MRKTVIVITAVFIIGALAFPWLGGCGDGNSRPPADPDYEVSQALVKAMKLDAELQKSAIDSIGKVKAGGLDIQKALDGFVDQIKKIQSLIRDVTAPDKPTDKDLARARTLAGEYLRNRVYQLEATLSAQTPADLEAQYARPLVELQEARESIVKLVLQYDPELRNRME